MKKIVIFGATDFGRMMKFYIEEDTSREVVAFTVDGKYIAGEEFCGLPLVAFEKIEEKYSPEEYEILIALGNSKMNDVRKNVFKRCKKMGYDVASFIHSTCTIHTKNIGEGNVILEHCLIYPYTEIGDCNLFWDNVVISHDCTVGSFNYLAGGSALLGYVNVGNNTFLGSKCVLNNYIEIADYTLVGAASFAKKSTKPYDVVVPARSVILEHRKSTDFM